MTKIDDAPISQKAWVVFSGQADCQWLRILKPGFRHCFVLIHDGQEWLSFDPMLNHLDIRRLPTVPGDFDLPRWLQSRGHQIAKAPVNRLHLKPAPLMIFTCVEAIKRFLGLHKSFIFTPWQLYRHLVARAE